MAQTQTDSDSFFRESLQTNVTKFALSASRMIDMIMGERCTIEDVGITENGLNAVNKCLVSILFTGTVYGEYLIVMDERVAASLLGADLSSPSTREDIEDSFRELLNVVVGETVVNLHEPGTKLTITPPRVTFGSVRYPNFKTGRAVLSCGKGEIECYLYIDRMKLDIASSYGQALSSLQAAHDELQKAMATLQMQQVYLVQAEKLAALGTMAAGVAHEINTPLATVSMLNEQLKEMMANEPIDKAEAMGLLTVIEDTVVRIGKITNGMRSFAHKAQAAEIAPTPFSEVVSTMLISCKSDLAEAGVQLTWEVGSEITVDCRSVELAHVLLNLVLNAKDAVAGLPNKWIKIQAGEVGGITEIRVIDSGRGIADNVREKVFDPFFTTKDVGKGTGLGLSVSKGIVTGHSGTISVDAKAANTTFVIKLPRLAKKAA